MIIINYTANEACEYLGVHKQSLEKYQRAGKLMFDYQFTNGERVYSQATLDRFKAKYQSPMMTLDEMAEMFNVSRQTVRYHFKTKRSIGSDAKRGSNVTYSDSKVIMVARTAGWIVRFGQEQVGTEYYGAWQLLDDPLWYIFHRADKCITIIGTTPEGSEAEAEVKVQVAMRRALLRRNQPDLQLG